MKNIKMTGWWFQIFFIFTPKIGEDEPILTSIFFRWVGKNHQLDEGFKTPIFGKKKPKNVAGNTGSSKFIPRHPLQPPPPKVRYDGGAPKNHTIPKTPGKPQEVFAWMSRAS